MLKLIEKEKLDFKSIILIQDSTMQYRMEAGLRKYCKNIEIINYAHYIVEVVEKLGKLEFKENIDGMWNIEKYISLLMGEIPRLRDDENGYGPKGKGYIAHVDIPNEVEKAFIELEKKYGNLIRKANPLYSGI